MMITTLIFLLIMIGLYSFIKSQPDTFRIERSIDIKASPETIFNLIHDFHAWERWSPWEKIDPALKRTYSVATLGNGAVYEWSGNKDIGSGRMEIMESNSPYFLKLKLDFLKPFEAHNIVEFTLEPKGDLTRITQAMYGPSPLISKIMSLFFSMDKMVGDKYEEGLANIKALAEA